MKARLQRFGTLFRLRIPRGWALTLIAALLVGLGLALLPGLTTHAASLTVNTLSDADDGSDGVCSLCEAITAANNNAGYNECTGTGAFDDDTITFSVSGTIYLQSALPNITAAGGVLTINGAGQITISGDSDNNGTGDVQVLWVESGATLNLQNLTVTKGYASGADGGGLFNYGGTVSITNSTFSGNSAYWRDGGGMYNNGGMVTITNSTFSENSANVEGGGIANLRGTVTITNSTFSGNKASEGGGIFNAYGPVTLRNTIVANSTLGGNCWGTTTDGGGNLSWPDATCPGLNQDPKLDPAGLQDNGGPTQTIRVLAGGAAIDAGNDAICAAAVGPPNFGAGGLDQSGVARPQGTHCDIGAYEAELVALTIAGAGRGAGTVTAPGINCTISAGISSGDCSERFFPDSAVFWRRSPTRDPSLWAGAGTRTAPMVRSR